MGGEGLDVERLDCYKMALQFQVLATHLVPRGHRALADQLDRASVSVVLNLAEGAARRSAADKAHFYTVARGSGAECAAVVDVLRVRSLASPDQCAEARSQLVRIIQMLIGLERSLSKPRE